MNISYCIWIILLFFAFTVPPISAGASEAVTEGIEGIFVSAADKIFEFSVSGYNHSVANGTVNCIYNVATYTVDPFKLSIYDNMINFSAALFIEGYKIILLIAFAMMIITHYRSDIAVKINSVTGINLVQKQNMLFKKALDGILIIIFMYFFIFLTLWFNDILSKLVMVSMLDSIAPAPSNYVLYFMMALAYGFMMIFFGLRTLVIGLFFGFAFIIGLCLLIEPLQESAETICAYFVQTVFFQFIIVAYFSLSILIINATTSFTHTTSMAPPSHFMYFIMVAGGVYLGIKLMFGVKVIKWAGKTVGRVV